MGLVFVLPPNRVGIDHYLNKLGNCASGTSGVPPPAWKNGGPATGDYIEALTNDALAGKPLPTKTLQGLFVFPPKGDASPEEVTSCKAYRQPKDLRPLTLKNEGNKMIAGVLNRCIIPTVVLCASILQRGFIPGRQLVQNVLDLDFHSRAHAFDLAGKHYSSFKDVLQSGLNWILESLPL